MSDTNDLRKWCSKYKVSIITERVFKIWVTKGVRTELGSGSFGSCYRLDFKGKQESLVVKEFYMGRRKSLLQEVLMLQICQHRGVQKLVGVCVSNSTLISHYEGRSLHSCLRRKMLSKEDQIRVLRDIMTATKLSLMKGIAHNDIREANICVKCPKEFNKSDRATGSLIDFGLACKLGKIPYGRPFSSEECDLYSYWIAPELLTYDQASEASEVYSIGKLAWRMLGKTYNYQLDEWINEACEKDPGNRPSLTVGTQLLVNYKVNRKRKRESDDFPLPVKK